MNKASCHASIPSNFITLAAIAISMCGWPGTIHGEEPSAPMAAAPFEGEKTAWHGFDRYDFVMDDQTLAIMPFLAPASEGSGVKDPEEGQRRCIVVVPKNAAPGHPWSWQGCYWDHQPQTEVE